MNGAAQTRLKNMAVQLSSHNPGFLTTKHTYSGDKKKQKTAA